MKFIESLTPIQTFFFPMIGLLVWALFLLLLFNLPQSIGAGAQSMINMSSYVLLGVFLIGNFLPLMYFFKQKKYKNLIALVLGVAITCVLFIPETILLFGIAISGGATG
jgi:hypothetical protein